MDFGVLRECIELNMGSEPDLHQEKSNDACQDHLGGFWFDYFECEWDGMIKREFV
jgi:hypothetical protein